MEYEIELKMQEDILYNDKSLNLQKFLAIKKIKELCILLNIDSTKYDEYYLKLLPPLVNNKQNEN